MIEPVSRSRRTRRRSRGRIVVWVVVAALVAGVLAGGVVLLARPQIAVAQDTSGLARVSVPGIEGEVAGVSVETTAGEPIATSVRRGALVPNHRVEVNQPLLVHVTVRRPGWAGWALGHTVKRTFVVRTPAASPRQRWLLTPSHGPVTVGFATPVRAVRIARGSQVRTMRFATPRSTVVVGRVVPGLPHAGSVTISAVPRTWEKLPRSVRVSWFPVGNGVQALTEPALGRPLRADEPLTITFARPLKQVLGEQLPTITPSVSGRWLTVDSHTITFRPVRLGYPLGGRVHVHLSTGLRFAAAHVRTLRSPAWNVPLPSTLRLHQLLAQAGYLPVAWQPAAGPDPPTARSELAAALDPPAGRFRWRYPNTPHELLRIWKPGEWNEITRGAVMMFEHMHGLDVDGFVGPQVWHALLVDTLAGKRYRSGYSYVYVHRKLPQSLNLWHDGRLVLTSPGNTGVPAAPTQLGTFPVFEHIPVGTMSGTNPDGTHYHDPGIRWISYFNHGDAIHAFNRASFGTPQSLGCVELPLAAAATVWPYTPIGTLVTIED
ncbi:MAG TPA: L,D-transpeptidase family protein [Gaiellaceae bacterium]|nr:L,D-transpeptidase family protein [Gaiellaceae bacterium]